MKLTVKNPSSKITSFEILDSIIGTYGCHTHDLHKTKWEIVTCKMSTSSDIYLFGMNLFINRNNILI